MSSPTPEDIFAHQQTPEIFGDRPQAATMQTDEEPLLMHDNQPECGDECDCRQPHVDGISQAPGEGQGESGEQVARESFDVRQVASEGVPNQLASALENVLAAPGLQTFLVQALPTPPQQPHTSFQVLILPQNAGRAHETEPGVRPSVTQFSCFPLTHQHYVCVSVSPEMHQPLGEQQSLQQQQQQQPLNRDRSGSSQPSPQPQEPQTSITLCGSSDSPIPIEYSAIMDDDQDAFRAEVIIEEADLSGLGAFAHCSSLEPPPYERLADNNWPRDMPRTHRQQTQHFEEAAAPQWSSPPPYSLYPGALDYPPPYSPGDCAVNDAGDSLSHLTECSESPHDTPTDQIESPPRGSENSIDRITRFFMNELLNIHQEREHNFQVSGRRVNGPRYQAAHFSPQIQMALRDLLDRMSQSHRVGLLEPVQQLHMLLLMQLQELIWPDMELPLLSPISAAPLDRNDQGSGQPQPLNQVIRLLVQSLNVAHNPQQQAQSDGSSAAQQLDVDHEQQFFSILIDEYLDRLEQAGNAVAYQWFDLWEDI